MQLCSGFPGLKGLYGLHGLKGQKGIPGTPGYQKSFEFSLYYIFNKLFIGFFHKQ